MTQPSRASENLDRIYLEPPPGSNDGRMWAEDRVEDDWVEYVRADCLEARAGEPVAWAVEDRCFGPDGDYDGPWRVAFAEIEREVAEAVADSYTDNEGPSRVVPLFRHPHPDRGEPTP